MTGLRKPEDCGPFVVTRFDRNKMKSVVVAGPFVRLEDADIFCRKRDPDLRRFLLIDQAKAFVHD